MIIPRDKKKHIVRHENDEHGNAAEDESCDVKQTLPKGEQTAPQKLSHRGYQHPSRLDHLDGIRALALTGVLLYHFELFYCRGGYTGVDVFLVLSGFLMTRNICNAIWQDTFSLKTFYVSRFWRLYPSSVLTVLCTLLVAGLIMGESMLIEVRRSAMSTLFMFSNFLFGSQIGGYFDGGAATKPLLHTWSLSVEEQFYACYPLFLVVFVNKGKPFFIILLLTTFVSFGLAIHFVTTYPTWTWYLLPTRIYEFMIGAIAFFLYETVPESQWWHEHASVVGLLGILMSYWLMSDQTTFPGWASLPSTLGAAFMILSPQSTLSTWVLSSGLAKWVGKISYGAYLVHWPIWVLVLYVTNSHDYGLECLAASIVLGWVQFLYFETPVREHRPKPVLLLWVMAILLAAVPQVPTSPTISLALSASQNLAELEAGSATVDMPSTIVAQAQSISPLVPISASPAIGTNTTVVAVTVPAVMPRLLEDSRDPYPDVHPVPPLLDDGVYPKHGDFGSYSYSARNSYYASWYNGNVSEIFPTVYSVGKKITPDEVPDLIASGDSFFAANIRQALRYVGYHKNISVLGMVDVGCLALGYSQEQIVEMAAWKTMDPKGRCIRGSNLLNVLFENLNTSTVFILVFRWHLTPLTKFQAFEPDTWGDRFEIEFAKILDLFRVKKHQLIIVTAAPGPPVYDPRICVERLGKLGGPKECPYWDGVANEILRVNDAIKRVSQPHLDHFVTLIDSESAFCFQDALNGSALKCRMRAQDGEPMYLDGRHGHLTFRGNGLYFQPLIDAYDRARQRLNDHKG